jgi:hypothetical protein
VFFLGVVKRHCSKLLPLKGNPHTCQILAFSESKRRTGYNGEEKFTRKTNSKTVPYKK